MTRPVNGANALSDVMRALADAERRIETPPHVEAAVMAGWDAAHPPLPLRGSGVAGPSLPLRGSCVAGAQRLNPPRRVFLRGAAALAAGVTLAFTLARLGNELQSGLVQPTVAMATTLLLVGEPILEGEPVRVVRMRVPASTLAAFGVRSASGDLADAVDLDVIVGEDGVARAIRVSQ